MISLQKRRQTWERIAFAGSLALAIVVLVGSLGASSRVATREVASFSGLNRPAPPLAGIGAGLDWVVEGVAWRNETVAVDDARLAELINTPVASTGATNENSEHWAPLAAILQRRMAVVCDNESTLVLGQDAPAFRARLTFHKSGGESLLASVRIARRDQGDAWRVTTSRLTDSSLPPASAAPLPLAEGDRLTAAGLSNDGTVQAALVEPSSTLDRLAASWRSAGWIGLRQDRSDACDSTVYQRGPERVRVTRVDDTQLAFVRLAGPGSH